MICTRKSMLASVLAGATVTAASAVAFAGPPTIAVTTAPNSNPALTPIPDAATGEDFTDVIPSDKTPACAPALSENPVAVIQLTQPMNAKAEIGLVGDMDAIIIKTDKTFYSACASGGVASIGPLATPWAPGKYQIFAGSKVKDGKKKHKLSVQLLDPSVAAPLSANVQRLTIDKPLPTPMFVEVKLRADRKPGKDAKCGNATFSNEPDIALTLPQPIPGLLIRPVATHSPVLLRFDVQRPSGRVRVCIDHSKDGHVPKGPTWYTGTDIQFGSTDSGTYGISVGLPPGAPETSVTLMIADLTTKFDPAVVTPNPIKTKLSIPEHALPLHFPQLKIEDLAFTTRQNAEEAASVFAAAPGAAFVYPTENLAGGDTKAIPPADPALGPLKNEPLLIEKVDGDRALVLAQDGMAYDVAVAKLSDQPSGAPAKLAAPRPLAKDASFDVINALLAQSDRPIADQLTAATAKRQVCMDKAGAVYNAHLPNDGKIDATTTLTPQEQKTLAQRDKLTAKQCGSAAAFDKTTNALRVKALAALEKSRTTLMKTASPKL